MYFQYVGSLAKRVDYTSILSILTGSTAALYSMARLVSRARLFLKKGLTRETTARWLGHEFEYLPYHNTLPVSRGIL